MKNGWLRFLYCVHAGWRVFAVIIVFVFGPVNLLAMPFGIFGLLRSPLAGLLLIVLGIAGIYAVTQDWNRGGSIQNP